MSTLPPVVHFVDALPSTTSRPHCVILTGFKGDPARLPAHIAISLEPQLGGTAACRSLYVDWLGGANVNFHDRMWWAFASTAKNFLSTPLGNQVLETLALKRLIAKASLNELYVLGASEDQVRALRAWAALCVPNTQFRGTGARTHHRVLTLIRVLRQFLITLIWHAPTKRCLQRPAKCYLLTYVDAYFRADNDAFFGDLARHLESQLSGQHVVHLAYLQAPYQALLPKLRGAGANVYQPLFAELQLTDIFRALLDTLAAFRRAGHFNLPRIDGDLDLSELAGSAFNWDIAKGGYFHNQLVYRAASRLARRCAPERILYPYENKSLEKMFLLGIRDAQVPCAIAGYQHTSVTPRHATLLFAPGEAAITPLPDRILTAGSVALNWLKSHGRYPEGLLFEACALRQKMPTTHEKPRHTENKVHVLLALSSSHRELASMVECFMHSRETLQNCVLGIRPHPEFPITRLDKTKQDWIKQHCIDFTGTLLAANLAWADVVAYVSSTVALEALMQGIPVFNFRIGDYLDPNPVIDPVALHWQVDSAEAFSAALRELSQFTADERARQTQAAITYAKAYLTPPDETRLSKFIQ